MANALSIADELKLGGLYLTDEYAQCGQSPMLVGVRLYEHQKTVVQAMLDLEQRRQIVLTPNEANMQHITNMPVALTTNAMVLAEKFGSGKTFEILAFIAHRQVPRALPTRLPGGHTDYVSISLTFTGPNALIRSNAIIVGPTVTQQWIDTIEKFTTFRTLVVDGANGLRRLAACYSAGTLNNYHIVIIRNAAASVPKELSKTLGKRRQINTIDAVSRITKGSCWARVFYDDFDVVSIPREVSCLDSLFTVYVSATTRSVPYPDYSGYGDRYLEKLRPKILPSTHDTFLFRTFVVRCLSTYVENSTSLPMASAMMYVYENPNESYVKLLYAMGTEDAHAMTEMINGDAMNTAAEAMGIKSNSVADIFQKMLDTKYAVYKKDSAVLCAIRATIESLAELPEGDPAEDLAQYEHILLRGRQPAIQGKTPKLAELLKSMDAKFAQKVDEDLLPITRMIDNIKEGECQICRLPLGEFDVFILRCCGIIVCDMCAIKGNKIQKHRISGRDVFQGLCANCMKPVNPLQDLVFVDKEFDIENALGSCTDDGTPMIEIPDDEPAAKLANPKHQALVDICEGRVPEGATPRTLQIPGLLAGVKDVPTPADLPRKVIFFANYNETLEGFEKVLADHNIPCLRLRGIFREKSATVEKFHEMKSGVLMINSQETCAGLNIQCATDVVFAHKILTSAVEAQGIGRAQRLGRKYNLKVHFLLYTGESRII